MDSDNGNHNVYYRFSNFLGGDAQSDRCQPSDLISGEFLRDQAHLSPNPELSPSSHASDESICRNAVSPVDLLYSEHDTFVSYDSEPVGWNGANGYDPVVVVNNSYGSVDGVLSSISSESSVPTSDMIVDCAPPESLGGVPQSGSFWPTLSSEMSVYDIFKHIPNELRNDPHFGPFVEQTIYRPSTTTDRKRYIADVALQREPIYFFQETARGWELDVARLTKGKVSTRLLGADEKVLEHCGPSISVRLQWQGYEPFSAQISSRDYRTPRGPATLAKLGYEINKVLKRFFEENKNKPVDAEVGYSWDLRRFRPEDLVLVSLHHISKGSWQPHLRLRHSLDLYCLKAAQTQ